MAPEKLGGLGSPEFNSDTWAKLTRYLEGHLDALRHENDSLTLSPERTLALRGRILEIKSILALSNSPIIVASPVKGY